MKTPKVNSPSALRLSSLGAVLALGSLGIAGCNSGSTPNAGGGGGGGATLATVGADSIGRDELVSALEASHGNEVLMSLIDYHLLLERAKADNIEVTDADVDASLAERQAKNPQIGAVVSAGGPQLDALRRSIRMDLTSQQLLTKDIKPTDAQLAAFFKKYAPVWYDEKASVKVGTLVASTQTRAQLMYDQLTKKTKTFTQLVEEQMKANDPAGRFSSATPQGAERLDTYPPDVQAQFKALPKGGVTKPKSSHLPQGLQGFIIFQVDEMIPAHKADFAKMKATVESDYKLAQVAKEVVEENKQNPPFDQALFNTANAYFGPKNGMPIPSLRDVLLYIDQYATSKLVAKLRTAGEVTIQDVNYAQLSNLYKPGGGAVGAPGAAAPAPGAPAPK